MTIEIKPKTSLLIVLFVVLAVYALYQARALLVGPRVWITSPEDGERVSTPLIVMEGQSRNIAWISLNGRQIFTDEEGRWSEKLIVSEGTSIMTVEASDRFGRETKKSIRIVLN
ncbi:MAG: hypothetical protein A3G05_00745 [Candidatus Zambryskibacteria bacterium RIFCSPLOWO2_12_FULL_45_14]|uniref:Uncharacterized protein n=2 Tax=Candidatus Zambryskiibacteriota TaxID=1817925 RepID=A0A1G2UJQ5_9BACT|nr:MAG: hypothetical protein A3H60_00415 [Candidatus Zambryskibacteria bacterium RIFCSPLOWO2_02_FULL_44_12b]OHB13764.1 MAG: hypothetical protein A3G05_00745 [Candidatus Zambryskibacteria bacterium RIFCSPLOWO2_12_FULL_45_14]